MEVDPPRQLGQPLGRRDRPLTSVPEQGSKVPVTWRSGVEGRIDITALSTAIAGGGPLTAAPSRGR